MQKVLPSDILLTSERRREEQREREQEDEEENYNALLQFLPGTAKKPKAPLDYNEEEDNGI